MSMFEDFMPPHGLDGDTEFMPLFSMEEEDELQNNEEYDEVLPVLAIKNTILFPGIIIPITVGRDKSIKAINEAYENCLLYTSPSPRDLSTSRMPSSA